VSVYWATDFLDSSPLLALFFCIFESLAQKQPRDEDFSQIGTGPEISSPQSQLSSFLALLVVPQRQSRPLIRTKEPCPTHHLSFSMLQRALKLNLGTESRIRVYVR
jgi:hypothetical protein